MSEKLQQFIDQESLYHTEGRRGLEDLCTIVAAIGYKDPQHLGAISRRAIAGDLLVFLEDNPGAIEALYEWIDRQEVSEWDESIEQHLITE